MTVTEPKAGPYRVAIRRDLGFEIKPDAEQTDGKVYRFTVGWRIDPQETHRYPGEFAMVPDRNQGYPRDAPIWVASGDLVEP